jgi:hypothetical protein
VPADRPNMNKPLPADVSATSPDDPSWLKIVREQVVSLRFGTVQIVVHDARVTQIEKIERIRIEKSASPERLQGQMSETRTNR